MDQNEIDDDYLKKAEQTYLELANLYNFLSIECTKNNEIKSIEEINELILEKVLEQI